MTKSKVVIIVIIVAIAGLWLVFGSTIKNYFIDKPEQTEADVPFTSQAPEGNWAEPWQNACEETVIVMIDNFYEDSSISPAQAKQAILELFKQKNKEFGLSLDEDMKKVAELIASADLGWTAEIVRNPSLDQLKSELAEQRPIIVPIYARKLDNPPYPAPGPDYHVVVLTGYDDETSEFIVNDPGSSQGEKIRYGYADFLDAIHDLNTPDYQAGEKAVLFTRLK